LCYFSIPDYIEERKEGYWIPVIKEKVIFHFIVVI
jgi:hypothetical protein